MQGTLKYQNNSFIYNKLILRLQVEIVLFSFVFSG